MIRYKVVKTCHGFKNRYWTEGQIVDLDDKEVPPPHFARFEGEVPPPVVVKDEPIPLSKLGRPPKVVGGMNAGIDDNKEPAARGRPKKEENFEKPI